MTFATGAGATFALSAAAPAAFNEAGYSAVVTTMVGRITSMEGLPSRVYNEVPVNYLANAGEDVGKGGYTLQATTLTVVLDGSDAAQALLALANNGVAIFTAKLDHPQHGAIYGRALIFGRERTWGDNDTPSTWEIEVRWKVASPQTDGIVTVPLIPPAPKTAPVITGTPEVGQPFAYTAGTYEPSATSYTYRLLRNGAAVAGFNPATYVYTRADGGATLALEESAGNQYGAAVPQVSTGVIVRYVDRLIESFDTMAGFTQGANSVMSQDTLRKIQGAASLKVQGDGTSALSSATKQNILTAAPADLGVVAYYVNNQAERQLASVDVQLGRGGTYYSAAGVTEKLLGNNKENGGYWHSFHVSEVPSLSALPTGQIDLKVIANHMANSPNSGIASVDALITNAKGRPQVCLTFDDSLLTIYTKAFPVLQALGLKATLYVNRSRIDNGANFLTLAQLQEMHAAGWDIGVDSAQSLNFGSGYGSLTLSRSELTAARTWLTDRGFTRAVDHMCWPGGETAVLHTMVLVPAVTFNGTNVATMASSAGLAAGQKLFGYRLPDGISITSVDSATQITMSAVVPAQTVPIYRRADTNWARLGVLPAAFAALGMKTARNVESGSNFVKFGYAEQAMALKGQSTSNSTLADMRAQLTAAKLRGELLIPYYHELLSGPSSGINVNQQICYDFWTDLAADRNAGLIDVLTISEQYEANKNNALPGAIA